MSTLTPKLNQISRSWHLLDAQDQVLGRLSTQIATLLIGKHKPFYSPNLDCGDYVVVLNAPNFRVTGKKLTDKIYYRHSDYPGGLHSQALQDLISTNPTQAIRLAVSGMLPKNKLRPRRLARLKIFTGSEHPYQSHFQENAKS